MPPKAGALIQRALASRVPYPYPGFGLLEIIAVDHAFRIAWRELVATQNQRRIDLFSAGEVEISEHLAQVLDTLSGAEPAVLPQAYLNNFIVAHRETALTNYNGKSLNKQPDLAIQPRINPKPGVQARLRCLFVEAKIYDRAYAMRNYARTGLIRFVNGDYAWAMPQGFMFAYVRDATANPLEHLTRFFGRSRAVDEFQLVGVPAFSRFSRRTPRLVETTHKRDFPDWTSFVPGDITVFHLWLYARPA